MLQLVKPVMEYLLMLLTQLGKVCDSKLLIGLEVMTGFTQTTGSEKINLLFSYFIPLLYPLMSLLEVYSNARDVVTSVLTFFSFMAENFTLFLKDVSSTDF